MLKHIQENLRFQTPADALRVRSAGSIRRAAAPEGTGRIAGVHPGRLIFAVWALTRHNADVDVDVQVRAHRGADGADPFPEAGQFLAVLLRRLREPGQDRA